MRVFLKKLDPDAKVPTLATPGSACYDIYSLHAYCLHFLQRYKIRTGLALEVPEGYGLEIRPKSGLAYSGLVILNSPATIDSDYRGEMLVSVMSVSSTLIDIDKGQKIAQVRLFPLINIEWEETDELSKTERGSGGFGSTGRQ